MRKGRCCFFSCCCCSGLVFVVLVACCVGLLMVVRQGMEPPVGYVKSATPPDEAKGKELLAQIKTGGTQGQLAMNLTKDDLRNVIAAILTEEVRDKTHERWPLKADDVQVDFGNPATLPTVAIPRAYPVPIDKSVQLNALAALNFAKAGGEPFVLYPQLKILAGVNDCKLYWTPVDIGMGKYNLLDAYAWAEKTGGKVTTEMEVQQLPLPTGTCASELSRDGDSLRIAFGPEAGAEQPTPSANQ
jgi:hypothetical protein